MPPDRVALIKNKVILEAAISSVETVVKNLGEQKQLPNFCKDAKTFLSSAKAARDMIVYELQRTPEPSPA